MARRTREWWSRLSPEERSELVGLERLVARPGAGASDAYLPEGYGECARCDYPASWTLCDRCLSRLCALIAKANGETDA